MLELTLQFFLIISMLLAPFFIPLVIFLLVIKKKNRVRVYKKPQTELEEIFGYFAN